jgi:hypothetical protein
MLAKIEKPLHHELLRDISSPRGHIKQSHAQDAVALRRRFGQRPWGLVECLALISSRLGEFFQVSN